jgi:DNA polymerase
LLILTVLIKKFHAYQIIDNLKTLAIDIETHSSTDLLKSGVYKYCEAVDFEIMLFAYQFDNEPVKIVDFMDYEELPFGVLAALKSPDYLKTAFNANFERTCIAKHLKTPLPPEQWECTSVKASMLGLPLNLDGASKALKLAATKDAAGKALIKYFSIPCKPTIANGERCRNLPQHDAAKWQQFKAYCVQDVVVEQAIREKIKWFTIPANEAKLWQLDQRINDGGIMVDQSFINTAISIDVINKERLTAEAIALTNLCNPNSPAKLKAWLAEETETEVQTLTKESVSALLGTTDCEVVKRVLTLRQEMSKTSVRKYEAMTNVVGADGRVRGLLQFYGANRTGRWAGRLVQVQNLPQNHLPDLDLARQLVRGNDADLVGMLFGNVPDTLSQLIRTAFIAPAGSRFIIADFSAIEARVIAWLAGEKWRMDVFNSHGKIYEASASQMFKVPIESVTKGSSLRQKGKVAELALGFQGGPNALIQMGALKMGLLEPELPQLVAMWRGANKAIVRLWDEVNTAAIEAVETGETTQIPHGVSFKYKAGLLQIILPSGRTLCYQNATLVPGKFGGYSLQYEGMNQTTKQWGKQDTYGGKLVENIIQAIARDCLAVAMLRLDAVGYKIVMHVHDENVLEVPNGLGSLAEVNKIMSEPIPWANGLPLTADSYETNYYKKD